MSRVVAFVPDLMDRSRFPTGVTFVTDPLELLAAAPEAALVIVDLSRAGHLEHLTTLGSSGERVVGFASHVDTELVEHGEARGWEVLVRSVFFRRLPKLVSEALAPITDEVEGDPALG
jgi:hypothetical protein